MSTSGRLVDYLVNNQVDKLQQLALDDLDVDHPIIHPRKVTSNSDLFFTVTKKNPTPTMMPTVTTTSATLFLPLYVLNNLLLPYKGVNINAL